MRVANAALAANFLVNRIVMAASVFDFGNIKLSFQCPFNFEFDSIKFSFSISCVEDFFVRMDVCLLLIVATSSASVSYFIYICVCVCMFTSCVYIYIYSVIAIAVRSCLDR